MLKNPENSQKYPKVPKKFLVLRIEGTICRNRKVYDIPKLRLAQADEVNVVVGKSTSEKGPPT